jgi:hypothetical protein
VIKYVLRRELPFTVNFYRENDLGAFHLSYEAVKQPKVTGYT